MPVLDGDFEAFVTNLGKYNEGMLIGEWVKLPTTEEEMQKVFERIGIGKQDEFGQPYEEWFITDYECPIYGVQKMLGEYESLDKLNYLAALIDELSLSDQEKLVAIMEAGCDEVSDIDDLINLTFNLDCYDIMPGINDEYDLGYYYANEAGIYSEKDLGPLADYIDYERYGHDIAYDEQGRFTDEGYVRVASERWDRQFNGELDDIPDEYRITGSGEDAERDSTIAVLVVEPGKEPYVKEIDSDLKSLQHEVGGCIEAIYPYEDPVALVCNEEGKLEGLPLNRALRDEDGDIYDVVAGTFMVVGLTDDSFGSLTVEQMQKFADHFKSAVGLAAKEMGGKGNVEKNIVRTQRDLSMKIIAIGSILTLILIVLFFYFDIMQGNIVHTLVAIALVAGISFLFTTVAANAIAIVGTNPVSGMTLMTLILASVVMVAVGLKGPSGMVAALVMGGVVCTALSMAGGFITDLKIGYWLGSTPAKQETWKFLGTIVSAATVGGVMIILNKTYGFTSGALAAPQANAMAAVIEPLMSGVGAPWLLYGIGAILAIVLTFFKIPALAFALGMFIPLELNVPLVVGGAVNWYVTSRSKDTALNTERGEKGTLLASGFIAGGALMGVVSAAMRFGGINLVNEAWLNNTWSEVLALGAYALLILYFIKASMKVK